MQSCTKTLKNGQEGTLAKRRIGKCRRTPHVGSTHGSWPVLGCTGERRMRWHSHSPLKHSSDALKEQMGSHDATWSWRPTNYHQHCSGSPGGRIKVPKTSPLQSVCVQWDHSACNLAVFGKINPCEDAFESLMWTVSSKEQSPWNFSLWNLDCSVWIA